MSPSHQALACLPSTALHESAWRGGHEWVTHQYLCARLAQILDMDFVGEWQPAHRGGVYVVPCATLDAQQAATLGVSGTDDVFGGIVPQSFVGTKVITHALVDAARATPPGWNAAFAPAVDESVLAGYAVFHADDLDRAARLLLRNGAVRAKLPAGVGGLGQQVITDERELDALLHGDWAEPSTLARDGLVLEQDLVQVTTLSIGQVQLGPLRMSYLGTQRCTLNNEQDIVYGGSRLCCVRGEFEALKRLDTDARAQRAIAQATHYHRAALRCFSGLAISRANYDVAQGQDARGRWCSGVLEQSWRIGGASHAEIEAAAIMLQQPRVDTVNACTMEVYGDAARPPRGALVAFRGIDPHNGPMLKYAQVLPHVGA